MLTATCSIFTVTEFGMTPSFLMFAKMFHIRSWFEILQQACSSMLNVETSG